MQALTGLTGSDWLLVLLYALGAVAVLEARRDVPGTRVAGLLVVPALAGVALVVALLAVFAEESRFLASRVLDKPVAIAVLAVIGAAALAFGDLFTGRLRSAVDWVLRPVVKGRLRADLALVLAVALPAAIAVAGATRVDDHVPSGYALSHSTSGALAVRASYDLPGHPMDLELRTARGGYVTFGEGWIGRFELSSRGLQITRVAGGLVYPRGIAIKDDTLFVAELGPLPCRPAFPSCKGGDVAGRSTEETERAILHTSRARVLAYDILRDGSLAHRREVLTELPVANSDHAVNDVAVGPDGRLYVSIGNLDRLYATADLEPDLARPHADLLGTVVSLEPDGSDLTVVARGLRNVYGLAFDRAGRLYGADNDGPTRSAWRREELLVLRDGADYGYPDEGSFAPQTRRREPPLWALDAIGSGGVLWIDGESAGTLLVGACSSLEAITLTSTAGADVTVAGRADARRLLELPGCVTTVKEHGDELLLGVFTFVGSPRLLVVTTPAA